MPSPKKNNKKKRNLKNKKKRNRKNKTKNTNTKNTKQTSNKQQRNSIDYEGFVFADESKTNQMPYWAVLCGSLIYIYKDKNNLDTVPYDVINISKYFSIQANRTSSDYFTIFFLNENDDFDHLNAALLFKNEENLFQWFHILQKAIDCSNKIKKNSSKQNYHEYNIIYNGWCIINNKSFFMELGRNNKLFVYNNDLPNKKRIMTNKLNNYKNVLMHQQQNEQNKQVVSTLFKYGFLMTCKNHSNDEEKNGEFRDFVCLFKQNNHRYEWITHIDYCINNTGNYLNSETDISLIKQNDYRQSLKLVISSLRIYDESMKNKNRQNLSQLNYMNILTCFHKIIIEDEKNNIKNERDQCCVGANKCAYVKRHAVRNKNDSTKTGKILLYELLDKIHCYFYHAGDNELVRDNISNKFVIDTIKCEDDENDDENDDEKKKDKLNNNGRFAFGQPFYYYGTTSVNSIIPYYSCLKEELLRNPYYTLTIKEYYNIYRKALHIIKTKAFANIKARNAGKQNRVAGIPKNEPISINHIITLLIYCNETELQKIFKKHTRQRKNEPVLALFMRQSFIAHWTRYLQESCVFYGKTLDETDYVYCGIDSKLTFDSFVFRIFCPFSTSSELTVANNFATNKGIIMKLKPNYAASLGCRYFDMMLLSDYIAEKEKFFCGAELQLVDIIIEGVSNKDTISALKLLQLILSGCLFYYDWNKDLYDDKIQSILVELLNRYVMNDFNEDSKYFHQLTSSLIVSFSEVDDPFGRKAVFLNMFEMGKLNKSLTKYFSLSKPMLFELKIFQNTKIRRISNILQVNLNERELKELKQLRESEQVNKIGDVYYTVYGYVFEVVIQKGSRENISYFYVGIELKSAIQYNGIRITWDMVCPQVKYQSNQMLSTFDRKYRAQKYCTFECSKIEKLNSISIDFVVRVFGFW